MPDARVVRAREEYGVDAEDFFKALDAHKAATAVFVAKCIEIRAAVGEMLACGLTPGRGGQNL